MIYRLVIIAFLLSGCSAMEIATDAALLADWSQTRQLPNHPELKEPNHLVLDEHPSRREVDEYFAPVLLVNTLLHREWDWFPRANRYRKKLLPYYQTGLLAIQFRSVAGNEVKGLKINFKLN